MTISNSNVANQVIKQTQSESATLHFFNHIAVVEFNEGVHLDLSSARPAIHDLIKYFGQKPFGLVANRVNSYSISLLDVNEIKPVLPNMVAYGVVSHSEAGRMNAKIESSLCTSQEISFDNLYVGLDTVYNRVKETLAASLN
ncbi:hypothetical protein [uncultured Winogradskyella sp.]|uniref:hypothetical protein n=1 Tax=uncultured Winogradskyella sp. TaxID=395353 RepID=UPI0026334E13|nr:hypothetical protein [uncultured Winogradskyella sp.]